MNTYFLVMATGIVHGTYGSALLDMAMAKASEIPFAVVFRAALASRPTVGKKLTPQVGWEVVDPASCEG